MSMASRNLALESPRRVSPSESTARANALHHEVEAARESFAFRRGQDTGTRPQALAVEEPRSRRGIETLRRLDHSRFAKARNSRRWDTVETGAGGGIRTHESLHHQVTDVRVGPAIA